ncbi:MAG: response regulator [Elusimicrobia bacterium]|nr:response regulator [Elusimicrobiota bacterium]
MNSKNIILLVEDNPGDTLLALRALKQHEITHEIVVAHDGAEAVQYLLGTGTFMGRSIPLKPRLVLLDLKMPKIDGLEVLRRLRADSRTKILPVVILSTSKEEEDILKSYNLGANSYICKPIDFDQFTKAIENLGLYWLTLNEFCLPF